MCFPSLLLQTLNREALKEFLTSSKQQLGSHSVINDMSLLKFLAIVSVVLFLI